MCTMDEARLVRVTGVAPSVRTVDAALEPRSVDDATLTALLAFLPGRGSALPASSGPRRAGPLADPTPWLTGTLVTTRCIACPRVEVW
jgi:hypothetical protein